MEPTFESKEEGWVKLILIEFRGSSINRVKKGYHLVTGSSYQDITGMSFMH